MTPSEVSTLAGRRERKKQATRHALRAAAVRLVSERGYAHVTVEDIAEAADVSVRTFFNYFPSKEAAVVGEGPETVVALRQRLLSLPVGVAPLASLREVLLEHLRAISEELGELGGDREDWTARFASLRCQPEVVAEHARYLAAVEKSLAEALLERLGGEEALRPYAALLTTASLAVVRAVGMLWGRQGGTASAVELGGAAFDLLESGFALEPDAGGKSAARLARLAGGAEAGRGARRVRR